MQLALKLGIKHILHIYLIIRLIFFFNKSPMLWKGQEEFTSYWWRLSELSIHICLNFILLLQKESIL